MQPPSIELFILALIHAGLCARSHPEAGALWLLPALTLACGAAARFSARHAGSPALRSAATARGGLPDHGLPFGCCGWPALLVAQALLLRTGGAGGSGLRGAAAASFAVAAGATCGRCGAPRGEGAALRAALAAVMLAGGGAAVRGAPSAADAGALCALSLGLAAAAVRLLPRCFTLGEATFLAQAVASGVWGAGVGGAGAAPCSPAAALVVPTAAAAAALALLLRDPGAARRRVVLGSTCVAWLAAARWSVGGCLGQPPERWVAGLITSDGPTAAICGLWLLTLALVAALPRLLGGAMPLTSKRKLFHLAALGMFAPAITLRPHFAALAFAVALSLMVLAEPVRAWRAAALGEAIDSYARQFTDGRDEGPMNLTHAYLLLGCAMPLWLALGPEGAGEPRALAPELLPAALGGVLSLGVLDALAAACGVRFGNYKWPGTGKTIEGTVCGVAGSLVVIAALSLGPDGAVGLSLGRSALALAAVGLLEAYTTQIDNLVLPAYTFCCFVIAVSPMQT